MVHLSHNLAEANWIWLIWALPVFVLPGVALGLCAALCPLSNILATTSAALCISWLLPGIIWSHGPPYRECGTPPPDHIRNRPLSPNPLVSALRKASAVVVGCNAIFSKGLAVQ